MRLFTFSIPGEPQGKGRGRIAKRGQHYGIRTPDKTREYEAHVARCARAVLPPDWYGPQMGPLRVSIVAYMGRPKKPSPRHECRVGTVAGAELSPRRWCTKTPDSDNVTKIISDGLNGSGVWVDDRQAMIGSVDRVWCLEGEAPRCDVVVEVLT